ncbi:pyruvate dehydrogenase (acetyl-transferring) E1 component subunit alpha [Galbitalea soli]|uniref:Pyruvate dehydrogenase (Acetyl-transferring) E1 component subunit alpha n=1 Tax=Galbitalea soli TaxID=1268042 RepID=A0A7C9PP04_9MICO|nr:pyruvate dehydrogenase (acetyl-transferring) E1 component subunit alpha [Galbitalea soli]NEM91788.1 pyruvate dehydrogenase (acetyl-transferring) E1 component subunit alpha [Galbitalea soli]NYJ29379.1 pyruvate dehydrogenase E1 component alpha subunit [Galbitalea soli]
MSYTEATLQLLSPEGRLVESDASAEYLPLIQQLTDQQLREFHRVMVVTRAFDVEATNLQRQGQMGLWVPSMGQEAAQVGSGFAARPQDHVFPAYREHAIAHIRGVDYVDIVRMLRGLTHGGWDPREKNNFHIYTLVIGSQSLHATGYAMGIQLDGDTNTGDPERDRAVIVYFGDGATSQGDVSEALVFAASYQTPEVFFLQNNQWAISVPVSTQSRTPLYLRPSGFGIPGIQIDGNDVLISYAATRKAMDEARSGQGPRFIEALTYRIGAHTSSDDPTKYRTQEELEHWMALDPITRFASYLRGRGEGEEFFRDVDAEAADTASDVRRRTLELGIPPVENMFDNVYSEPHPLMQQQKQWLADYEASFDAEGAAE